MSVNITVNGKFVSKHCSKNPLLLDREKAKKELEEERRKKRLLQVREQSKKIAEKIRNDVKETRRKDLEKFESKKQEEFETWRRNAMQKNEMECSRAIFQIGAAHEAAKRENQAQAEKLEKKGMYKEFRKQILERKHNKENAKPSETICKNIHICPANSRCQWKCYGNCSGERVETPKRKRYESCSSSDSDSEKNDEETSNDETLKDSSSFSSITPSKSINNMATQTSLICQDNNLKKTPAVYMDVEVGTDDSVLISAPLEIKDKHAEYNRQFSRVIRISPRKGSKNREAEMDSNQPTSASTITTSRDYKESEETSKKCSANETSKAKDSKEKRFTIISDLVNKQGNECNIVKDTEPNKRPTNGVNTLRSSPRKFVALPSTSRPPISRPISQNTITSTSPTKATSISSKSSKPFATGNNRASSISAASTNTVAMGSSNGTSCRVQFYDYNSKIAKEGSQSQTNVRVNRQRDTILPTAMEQASVENRLQYDKQQDMVLKNKQMDERSQKALEREKIRRDCNDLTEKLDALTRQYPRQVPTNENPHIFVDKQLRLESKMNSAVEKILSRPNVITCTETGHQDNNRAEAETQLLRNDKNRNNDLNVGAATSDNTTPNDDAASDSCCSILLGYVDDQSRQVRKDLEKSSDKDNIEKQRRLRNLLQRLDELRNSLLEELKNSQVKKIPSSGKESHYQQLIEDITSYRRERENIMMDNIEQQQKVKGKENDHTKNQMKTNKKLPLDEREKVLQQKEAILEEKVREFYELQKQKTKTPKSCQRTEDISEPTSTNSGGHETDMESDEKENCTSIGTPVEIVITVQGDKKSIKFPGKSKRKPLPKKHPTQLASLIKSPQPKAMHKKSTPRKRTTPIATNLEKTTKAVLGRQNSYDSNSTSYMSLPQQIATQLGTLVDKKQNMHHIDDTQSSTDNQSQESQFRKPAPHLNPLIAQYVQRLLGMSRKAIQRLGVSSSDIDTPSSSLINTSANNTSCESLISDERLAFVESFVKENRSFIKELEQSLKSQNDTTLENSMRVFDEIWRKRLKQQKVEKVRPREGQNVQEKLRQEKIVNKSKETTKKQIRSGGNVTQSKIISNKMQHSSDIDRLNQTKSTISPIAKNKEKFSRIEIDSSPEILGTIRNSRKIDKAVETQKSNDLDKSEQDSQIARYAQLTENCTHRIAELTELINRVRQEKQRLLEVTLSSVSDNGRQSTEYLELPEGKSRMTNEGESSLASSTEDAITATVAPPKSIPSMDIVHQIPKLSTLEKNRQINASQDSGIAESRPITAQENRLNDVEPISQTSTESQGNSLHQRKLKPPPSLRRFSPQFQEDDLVHELSTILEVDTPANSRINTAVAQSTEERTNANPSGMETTTHHPIIFPKFEEYCQRMNLDITKLDKEKSLQLQAEFSIFMEDMQRSQTKEPKTSLQYTEFPSMNGYMNHTKSEHILEQAEPKDESLNQLRLTNLKANKFPAVREYVQQNYAKETATTLTNDDGQQLLLDTESLENITESESASLDIEKELKERKILKNSFRYSNSKRIFSSTAHHGEDSEFYVEALERESGIEKLSTSDNTIAVLEADVKGMMQQWTADDGKKRNFKYKQLYQSLSSTTTSTTDQSKAKKLQKSTSLDDSSNEIGRPLNLRDFLTRELLKHANFSTSTSTSSTDDSLRSQFLYSLIGSLTPHTNAATSKSGQHTLDRQKTSTPVPIQSSQTHSTPSSRAPSNASSTQLFSGESRISSVHGNDHSKDPRWQISDAGDKGDQSSE
ncbi:anastral spindle 1 [Haematobia irritans]|uniref:anastral spindle 1 n=1 Tax=Haematobia irritans TaxID=7368 RepID=UPI003F4FB5C7